MTTPGRLVIVGGGLAGVRTAEALRDRGYVGELVLLGAEPHLPYERPALSKGYLLGTAERDSVFAQPASWYAEQGIDLRTSTTVRAIDRTQRAVVLADGSAVRYDGLLLATGAVPRRLDLPGNSAAGVHQLRTLDDCEALIRALDRAERLVVIGGGWIGLEVAAAARSKDVAVTLVEREPLPLLGVLGTDLAQVFADLHREHGVELHLAAQVAEIATEAGAVHGVRLATGELLPADAVLVAVGVVPDTALAEAAGLDVDNGVVVDAALRTSDPAIVAAGDIANAFHPLLGRHVRVEHWANARNQPLTAATTLLGGDEPYDRLPYFYTDQYDLGMEYVGHAPPGGYDELVIRGDLGARQFVAFWLASGRVVAGMNVNTWDVVEPIKELIRRGGPVDPVRLADADVPIEEL